MNNLATVKMVGNNITSVSEFKDINGVIITPINVTLKYKTPAGVVLEADIIRLTAFKYTSTINLNLAGDWTFRWECTGDYAASEEFTIHVLPSKI